MNINEIAKLANVSQATVSRYFNDGYVSAEKREQIRRVIEETGYKPSAQAQMLRTKKDEADRCDYPEDQFRIHQRDDLRDQQGVKSRRASGCFWQTRKTRNARKWSI